MWGDRDNDNQQGNQGQLGGNVTHGGGYPAGAGVPHGWGDFNQAANMASDHAGDSGDSSFFSSVLKALDNKKDQVDPEDIDEDDAVRSHKQFFGNDSNDDNSNSSSRSIGSAAAMQAMKMFSGGQAGGSHSQGQFIALAMGEASKLFDKQASQGKVSSDAGKESAVMHAGEMALKMYMKSQGGAAGGSSGSSGGASALLGMAKKFF